MDEKLIIGENESKRFVNLEGLNFGKLKVLYYAGKFGNGKRKRNYFYCLCECGNHKVFESGNLTTGHTNSCGCLQKERASKAKLIDISGNKYGRLTVIKRATMDHQPKWLCICDCGKEVITSGLHLKSGHTKSCGCLLKESRINNIKKVPIRYGKEHPSYNHEISDEDRVKGRFLFKKELEDWRKQVFERDEYTCKFCCKKGSPLNAHHLDGYHWCKEKRFETNNGITLCEKCHTEFHKKYGYRNNTQEQFWQFLSFDKSAIK